MKHTTRTTKFLHFASVLMAAWGLRAPAYAEDENVAIDKFFQWAAADCPGCAVAVSLNNQVVVNRAYGSADLERAIPMTTNSIFDAGSLQKQFVAVAVLLLVQDGKLSLSEDIRHYLPELNDYGHKVTLRHLLTHTSGVRDWTGLLMLTAEDADALSMILRQRGLNFPPGEEWSYSNSGVVLAKEIVARTSGLTFAEFTRTRMFEPLGMKSTQYCTDIHAVIGERALAYNKQGDGWRAAMMLGKARGGGGIFTTAADLITWNHAIITNRFGEFVSETLQQPATLNNGRTLDYAHGVILGAYRGAKEIWHTGSADGYKSYLGYFPDHRLSIAVMCNHGDEPDRQELAYQIFELFVPNAGGNPPAEGEGPPPLPNIPPAELEQKAGLFVNQQTGQFLQLAVDRGRLRVAGGPGLVAENNHRFRRWGAKAQFMSGDAFELDFKSVNEFVLKSMEGKTTLYRRVEPYQPTALEFNDFVGRYHNDEIGSVLRIVAQEDRLIGRLEHMPPAQNLKLNPVERDTFQFNRMVLRFLRDQSGAVVAIDYSNPMLRNIKFTRLSDRQ